MMRYAAIAMGVGLWCGILGCQKKAEPVVVSEPEIGLADIARTTLDVKTNAYFLLSADQTMGRFPGAIAVARLKLSDAVHDSENAVALKPLLPSEAAYWNHLFDNLPSIRVWFELRDFDIPHDALTTPQLVKAAGRLHASLCLLYGVNVMDEDAKLVGVLYDTRTAKPLATFHAQSAGVNDWLILRPEDRHKDDYRHQDNTYLASRKFESFVYNCVVNLINRDQPERIDKPEGWKIIEPGPELYQKIR